MDKKNTTIGVLLLLAAFATLYFAPRSVPPPQAPAGSETTPIVTPGSPQAPAAFPGANSTTPQQSAPAAQQPEIKETLSNGVIEVAFTNAGGAVRDVSFVKRDEKGRLVYPEDKPKRDEQGKHVYPQDRRGPNPFVFNQQAENPILAFDGFPGLDRNARFERVSKTANEIVYRAILGENLEVTRRYVLSPNAGENTDPYVIRYETIFRNRGSQPIPKMQVALSLGTAAPTDTPDGGIMLKTGYSTGSDQEFIPRSDLEASSGFMGIGAHASKPYVKSPGPLSWASVQKFFASILTSDVPATSMVTQRVPLGGALPQDDVNAYGITGASEFEVSALAANGEAKLAGSIYVGPKEYRLANVKVFKADQDKIMDFGFFKWFSQILLTLMTWIHGWTGNWGMAIILTTLSLKTIFIPFTIAASKSAKRMAKLQPELTAIREKHKDNPQKQQQATMELFKTRKINPVGGCLPILLTMPFFMGFFQMLPSVAELRFQPFLWAPDLSSTDTIAVIPLGFMTLPINIMPILMGATMVIQMHLTPTPSVDNAQMKMMKFMPYIFTLFCYTFSCALSLYSFVNGLFTIGQQLVINRMKDDPGPVGPGTAAASTISGWRKGTKNVTPSNKKLK